jgi:hypothetical protein
MAGSSGGARVIDMTPCCPLDDCPLARLETTPRSCGYVGRHRAPATAPAGSGAVNRADEER